MLNGWIYKSSSFSTNCHEHELQYSHPSQIYEEADARQKKQNTAHLSVANRLELGPFDIYTNTHTHTHIEVTQ